MEYLFNSREVSESIFQNISDGVFIFDKDGKLVMMNENAERLTLLESLLINAKEYSSTEYFYENGSAVPPNESPSVCAKRGEVVKKQRLIVRQPHRELVIEFSYSPIYDKNGNLDMIIMCTNDVTEIVQKERIITKKIDNWNQF